MTEFPAADAVGKPTPPATPPVNPTVAGIGTSIVRTVVPLVVGMVVAAGADVGLDLPEGLLTESVAVIVTTVYYAAVRTLETKVGPAWGWLLGVARAPEYVAGKAA